MENQNVMQNLRMGRKDNLLDDLAFGLVNATNYSNTAVPYPDVKVLDPDGGGCGRNGFTLFTGGRMIFRN